MNYTASFVYRLAAQVKTLAAQAEACALQGRAGRVAAFGAT
jgi:hypothetical protein